MGHLTHLLDKEQFYRIGRIDVLIVPVDGRVTSSYEELTEISTGISPSGLLLMPLNVYLSLNEFLEQAEH